MLVKFVFRCTCWRYGKKAAECGAEAMAITEHGNMASLEEFLDCCKGLWNESDPRRGSLLS